MQEQYNLQKNGFQVLRGVIPSDIINTLCLFLQKEMQEQISILEEFTKSFGCADLVAAIDYIINNKYSLSVEDTVFKSATGLFPLKTRLSKILLSILQSDKLISALQEFLKTKHIKMHMPPAARFILPNNKHGMVPPHQDISYNTYVENFLVVWVPLTSITKDTGGVGFFEKTDKAPKINIKKGQHVYWLPPLDVSDLKLIHVELEPGDVIIFDKEVIHQSMPNNSNETRISIDYRFFDGAFASLKHCYDLSTNTVIPPEVMVDIGR